MAIMPGISIGLAACTYFKAIDIRLEVIVITDEQGVDALVLESTNEGCVDGIREV